MRPQRYALLAAMIAAALLLTAAYLPSDAPAWLRWLRPDWTLAVLFYWIVAARHPLAPVWAWLLGLLVDVLLSDILGLHALTFALAVFAAKRFEQRLALFSLPQQAGIVALTALGAEVIRALLRAAAAGTDPSPLAIASPLTTAAVFALLVATVPHQSKRLV